MEGEVEDEEKEIIFPTNLMAGEESRFMHWAHENSATLNWFLLRIEQDLKYLYYSIKFCW